MAGQKSLVTNLTEGSVTKQLIRFSIPFMLSNALQVVYSMVDMLVVGHYVGSSGLSAVSIASQIVMLMTTICMGFATGGQVYISQLVGANDKEGIKHTIGTLFSAVLGVGVLMTIIALTLHRPFLNLLNTPAESYDDTVAYMLICGGGIIFTYGYNMVSAVLRGMGDSKRPLYFVLVASVLNLILDVLFVGPLHMGVAGAAWATIIGQAVSFIVSIIYLYHRREAFGFDFKLQSFAVRSRPLKVLIKLGIPFAISSSAINISMLFVNGLVNDFGVYASATFGVGSKVQHVPDILTRSISMAAAAMIGQNMGAGSVDRAKKVVWVSMGISLVIYAIAAVVFALFPQQIFGLFTGEQEVIALAWLFISTMLIGYPAHIVMSPCNAFIQGIGNAPLSLVIALLDGFVMRISLSYLFGIALDMGLFGFFLGYNLATYGTAIPSAAYFLSGKWKKRKMLVG